MRITTCLLLLSLVPAVSLTAQERVPLRFDQPDGRTFVIDKANLLTNSQESQIERIGDRLLTDRKRALLVVTIESMAAHGGRGLTLEKFARDLFGQLGLGHDDGTDGNRGMLLLVSSGDRQARIELGADWPVSAERKAQQIMSRAIVPRFKAADFGGGIVSGAQALDAMARSASTLPAEQTGPGTNVRTNSHSYPGVDTHYVQRRSRSLGGGGFFCVILFGMLVLSAFRGRSRRGGGGFSLLSLILWGMANNSHRRSRSYRRSRDDDDDDWGGFFGGGGGGGFGGGSSGGGFSGGSFGGGFSGGGGASGSW